MDDLRQIKKNPSRETCEKAIRRILTTELKERGKNEKFKNATDFMPYFESLYIASPSLTKQVQRAIHAMDLPKDKNGYFIINKSRKQIEDENSISTLLKVSGATISEAGEVKTIFLKCQNSFKESIMSLIYESDTFKGLFDIMAPAYNGIIFFT